MCSSTHWGLHSQTYLLQHALDQCPDPPSPQKLACFLSTRGINQTSVLSSSLFPSQFCRHLQRRPEFSNLPCMWPINSICCRHSTRQRSQPAATSHPRATTEQAKTLTKNSGKVLKKGNLVTATRTPSKHGCCGSCGLRQLSSSLAYVCTPCLKASLLVCRCACGLLLLLCLQLCVLNSRSCVHM